jgi:hypothetical protein
MPEAAYRKVGNQHRAARCCVPAVRGGVVGPDLRESTV